MVQKLKFEVYDIDSDNCSLEEADFLGQLECTLGQVSPLCLSQQVMPHRKYLFIMLFSSLLVLSIKQPLLVIFKK